MLSHESEKFLNDVFLTLQEQIKNTESAAVSRVKTPEELKSILPALQSSSVSYENLVQELRQIIDHSVSTTHPLFLNQLFGGFDPASWAGEIASSLLNPTMATFEIAPMLTIIEKRLVAELLRILGFDRGEGIMVTGGSNANLVAMLCARTDYNPSIRQTGFSHNNFRVYVSEEAHYSFDKAANITGIGTQNLIQIPCNERGEMIPEELRRILAADIRDGFTPIMVGATAGSTVLGSFDPLREIAKVCEVYNVWLHVDAAWGGAAVFSPSARELLDGIDIADSITFDAHKTLGTPLVTSFFLTKHSGILRTANRGGGAEYLFHEYDNSEWDTGTYSLQCGRRADALKIWLLWRSHGTEGLAQRTEELLSLAHFARQEVDSNPRFKLVHANYLNVCFQVLPETGGVDVNKFTQDVRYALVRDGKAMVNFAERADGTIFFRLVFPNHNTKPQHVVQLLDLILEKARQLEKK